jgi:hypothetical protein
MSVRKSNWIYSLALARSRTLVQVQVLCEYRCLLQLYVAKYSTRSRVLVLI